MSTRNAVRARLLLRSWVPFALLAAGIVLSIATANYVSSTERATADAEFATSAGAAAQQIQFRIDTYLEVVRAGGALLQASNEIPAAEFRNFVAALDLRGRYPGLIGIGFAARAPRRQLPNLLRYLRLEGSTIRVFPAGVRPEYFPVVFLEPRTRTATAIGFDLGTHGTLRQSMDEARDTGALAVSPSLSDPNPLAASPGQLTAVVLLATYRSRATPLTVDDRRAALVGFVVAPIDLAELLRRMSQEISGDLTYEMYDASDSAAAALPRLSDGDRGPYHAAQTLLVGDRRWIVLISSKSGAWNTARTVLAERTRLIGFAVSLLVFVISVVQIRAWRIAATHEAELRASEEALRNTERDLRTMVELERHARNEAQTASRAKDEFLAMISHELRTPLNAVIGWVSMLRSGVVRDDRRGHALETIERNARLQVQLIEDLLDVSRLAMGKTRLDLRPVTLDPIVTAVVDSLRPAAETKGLTLNVSTEPDASTIRADSARVQQIVWNLVSNGIKFTPPGGRVDVEIARQPAVVRLCVRDTGIGIRPEFLPHVFERFRQADTSTTRGYGGIGLGLAIVRDLVDLHGGTISATSEGKHRGATFTVDFPIATASSQPAAPILNEFPSVPSLHGVRILVVDDDVATRELLSEALASMNARTSVAASAAEAVDKLLSEGADVLLSDIAMPDEDGLSLMRRIRAMPGDVSRIPAIALTAYARAEDRDRALEAGFHVSLTKPVSLSQLQDSIAEILHRAA